LPTRRKKRVLARSLRFAAASLVSIALVALVLAGSAYFYLQGNAAKGFEIKLQNADLSFSSDARVVFKSKDVRITKIEDNKTLADIGEIEAKLNLLEALSGSTAIELVRVQNAEVDADVLGSGRGVFLPTHLDVPFNAIGDTLSKFQLYLDQDKFEELEIINSVIKGAVLGRKQTDPIALQYLSLNPDGKGKFILNSRLKTEYSNINLNSSYACLVWKYSFQQRT